MNESNVLSAEFENDQFIGMSDERVALNSSELNTSLAGSKGLTSLFSEDVHAQEKGLNLLVSQSNDALRVGNVQSINMILRQIVQILTDTPFETMRAKLSSYLNDISIQLKLLNIKIPRRLPPSRFFKGIVDVNTQDEEAKAIFKESFTLDKRVTNLTRILAWHPKYYKYYHNLNQIIMCTSGPLNYIDRHLISMMAAARYRCSYIIKNQVEQLVQNHEVNSINDIVLSPKLEKLALVNAILAHQPWKLRKEHIQDLVRGDANNSWNVDELVHTFVIMSAIRVTSSLVWALGVNAEFEEDTKQIINTSNETSTHEEVDSETLQFVEILRNEHQEDEDEESDELEYEREKQVSYFVDSEQNTPATHLSAEFILANTENSLPWLPEYDRFYHDVPVVYQNFDVHAPDYKIIHVQDYSWSMHGFSLMKKYYPNGVNVLDEIFKFARIYTSGSVGDQKSVDTEPFREGIWHYVHRIHGLFHDDYDYLRVNQFVPRGIKEFIKKVVCEPYTITKADLKENFKIKLYDNEKVHVALLALEARRQAELLYGLHAVASYMKAIK
eukprot:TRINITY_DN5665_c0_g1_i1.p1 TRINITY_DN5665_c0_g1~~TRINITY_DN5665_c0_g1_i1.p1  ORF type:complete len:556 (+),score=73.54 TRINITY_DN5665_c0_g1_i1:152-1819(+)